MRKRKHGISILAGLFILLTALAFARPAAVSAKTYNISLKTKKNKDITKEFQEALNKAKNGKDKVNISLKKGTYKLTSMLSMYSNTTISMNGATLKRTASKNNEVMLRLGKSTDKKSGYSGYKNITIKNGTFDGGGRKGGIVRLGHAKNIKLNGVTFTNVKNSHFVEIAACSNVTINKCSFTKYVGDRKESLEALQFDILEPDHFSGYGEYDETPCKKITVKGCTFRDLSRAAGTHNAYVGSYHTDIQFLNNTFTDITGYAITTFNYRNALISGNKITNCGAGIVFRTMNKADKAFYVPSKKKSGSLSSNSRIVGNEISLNASGYLSLHPGYKDMTAGIWLSGELVETDRPFQEENGKKGIIPAGDYTVREVTVQNNQIALGMRGVAICLYGAKNNNITGNTITCNITDRGMSAADAGSGDGIRLAASSNNTISGNHITNGTAVGAASKMSGISLTDASSGNTLLGNVISGASQHGIVLTSSEGNVINDNTVENVRLPNGIGISVRDKSNNTKIRGNRVSSDSSVTAQSGICIANNTQQAEISGNIITKGGQYGIFVKDGASDVTIRGNTILNSGQDGILVSKSQRVSVSANTIQRSGQYGLLVKDNASVTASGNGITASGKKDMYSGSGGSIS